MGEVAGARQPTRPNSGENDAFHRHGHGKEGSGREPSAEAKEVVAGLTILQVKSKEEAIEWVKRVPNPTGEESVIEIRQVYESEDFGPELLAAAPEVFEAEDRFREQSGHK